MHSCRQFGVVFAALRITALPRIRIVATRDPKMKMGPFLGGWRNKVTGTIYWNTCTQTGSRCTREVITQTEFSTDKCVDTQCNVALQVHRVPDIRDRIIEVTAPSKDSSLRDSTNEKILQSVIKIQRFYRAYRGRKTTIQQGAAVPRLAVDTDQRQIPAPYPSRDFVILNRTSPRTRTDFELLYNLLDRWRIHETERAAGLPFEPSRTALCSLILSKEVELLRSIDSIKTAVKSRRRERSYSLFLDELSKPVLWPNSQGKSILVDTPPIQRARSYKDTFRALSNEGASNSDRITILSTLKRDLESHTCKLSCDLLSLIDQEIDLLNLRIDGSKLNWLRGRIKITFLELARNALRNDFEDVGLIGGFRSSCKTICRSCGRLLPVDKFPREKSHRSSSCNYCLYVKVRTQPRVVYGPYERMLRNVRRNEARMHCCTSLAFVVDSKLVYRLVNDIWHGKSAISENEHLDELRLPRFRRGLDWSPWNCLLLTAEEASLHEKLEDLDEFYGEMLLQKFHTRNLQAKVQFAWIAEINSGFR